MGEKEILEALKNAVVNQDEEGAAKAAKDALAANMDPLKCIDQGLAEGMKIISDQFDKAEVFVPQIVISADAFMGAVEILKQKITGEFKAKGTVIVHTVEGDIHDIGKSILRILLTASGFEVTDLGRDVPVEHVCDVAEEQKIDIITGSSLMSTSMPSQKEIIKALKERGVRDKFKVFFGGAPTNEEWVKSIGADGWAENAPEGVKVISKAMG